MERQKVLYVARTKTANVIRPISRTRSFPSPSSSEPPGSEPFPAPLASVESELAVATRLGPGADKMSRGRHARVTETMTNVSSKQRPTLDSAVCRKESSLRDNRSHKELRDSSSHKELRDNRSHKELRNNSSPREPRDNSSHREPKDNSSHKELRDNSSHKELRDNSSHRELRDNRSHKELKNNSSPREPRDNSSHRELRDNSSHREPKDNSSHRELRDNSSHKELRDNSSHNELRDNSSHKELRDTSNRRTYVKPRATNFANTQNENPGIPGNHKIRNEQFLARGLSPPEPKPRSTIEYDLPNCAQALTINTSHNAGRDEINHCKTNNSNDLRRADRKPQRNVSHGSTPMVRKNNVRSPENNFAKTPPPVAPKPKNISTTSTVVSDFEQNLPISDYDANKPKRNSTQCPGAYQNGSQSSKENYIGPSPALSENIPGISQTGKDKPQSIYKPGSNSFQSLQNLPASSAQRKSRDGPGTAGEHTSTRLLPETIMPVNFQLDNHPLPEMYTKSPPLNTAAIRPMSSRLVVQHTSHMFQPRSGPRKPLAAIDTRFNTPINGVQQQSNTVRQTFQNTAESNEQYTHNIISNRKQSVEDISSITQEQTESSNILPEPEIRNSWKRNSMRLATCGYTSMSDLTVSMECIAGQIPDVTAKEYSQNCYEFVKEDLIEQGEMCTKAPCHIKDMKEDCKSASVTNDPESPMHDSVSDSHNKTLKPTTDDEDFGRINFLEQPVLLERNGINRLSYRMATSSISDISILCDDMLVYSNKSDETGVMARNRKNNDSNPTSPVRRSRDKKCPESNNVRGNGPLVIGNAKQQPQAAHIDTDPSVDRDKSTHRLKRPSTTQATASTSDQTFPYVEYNRVLIPNKVTPEDTNTTGSTSSSGVHTSDSSQQGQLQDGSYYSNGRDSSFGSVYSFKSQDNSKVKSPQEKVVSPRDRPQARHSTDFNDAPLPRTSYVEGDSLDSEGSASGDTTYYYTASDTSFITTDVDQLGRQNVSSTTHRLPSQSAGHQKQNLHTSAVPDTTPPKSTPQNQRFNTVSPHDLRESRQPIRDGESHKSLSLDEKSHRLSSSGRRSPRLPISDRRPEHDTHHKRLNLNPDSLHHQKNSPMLHDSPLKQSTPVNNGLHCHVSGSGDRSPAGVATNCNEDIAQATSNNNGSPEKCHCSIDGLAINNCNHSAERYHVMRAERSPKNLPIQMLKPADFSHCDLSSSLSSSASFCSLNSSVDEATWEDTPRFPPSLGKPRRKLYAGFDSQPLPMDSFISDSSSIYSMQTCGSSRSAEVESSSRTFTTAPNVRAVSSIVSSTHAPVRCISQEEMLDLFKYTDKVVPARENNHNIYFDDRFKDNCYDKTFSSESLESFRSDDTIVGSDPALEHAKLRVGIKPGSWSVYNNTHVDRHDNTGNNRRHLNKLNNSHGLDFGSRLSNNTFVGGNVVNSKNQLKAVKGKKYAQPFCMCRQSSLDPFIVPDGTVTVIRTDTGQWDISI